MMKFLTPRDYLINQFPLLQLLFVFSILFTVWFFASTITKDYKFSESVKESVVISPLSVRFFGDVMLARNVERLLSQQGNDYVLKNFEIPTKTDFSVINFESAMVEPHVLTPNFTFRFATNPDLLPSLSPLSVTHASLANNHGLDYGASGYALTKDKLQQNNIETFGHPTIFSSTTSVKYLSKDNMTLALIAVHTLFSVPTEADIKAVMDEAKNQSDLQIIYIHWGDEYELVANASQRRLAEILISHGANVIVGHHPHVVQNIEIINGVPVFYSLGNFIFDQYFSSDVMEGLVVDMVIDESITYNLYPITSQGTHSQPRLMTDEERLMFLQKLAERSGEEIFEMLIEGEIRLAELAFQEENGMITE